MNFLYQFDKNSKKKLNNRAYQQLLKKRSPHRHSFTNNQSKQLKTNKREEKFQNTKRPNNQTERSNLLNIPRKVNSSLFCQELKHINEPTYAKSYASSSQAFYPSNIKKVNLSEAKEIPVSFSSYIIKNKARLSSKKSGAKLNLRYFDLDEIANQMASPMKLENKIDIEEQKIRNRKNKLFNLNNFHSFLMDIQKDNTRYNTNDKINIHKNGVRTQHNPQKSPNFIKNQQSQVDRRSIWRKNLQINNSKAYQNIIPWTQNQQQNSPLRPNRRIRTKALEYSDAQIFKINQ